MLLLRHEFMCFFELLKFNFFVFAQALFPTLFSSTRGVIFISFIDLINSNGCGLIWTSSLFYTGFMVDCSSSFITPLRMTMDYDN